MVLIIWGMHRSGTSLTAQWMQKSGIDIGEDLLPAKSSNLDGHYEDREFLKLHESILKSHGYDRFGLTNVGDFTLIDADVERIQKLVDKKYEKKQWGWKEPRTCLFVDAYLKLLPNAYSLIVLRDYRHVINSLLNRELAQMERDAKAMGRLSLIKFKLIKRFRAKKLAKEYAETTIVYYQKLLKVRRKARNFFLLHFENMEGQEDDLFEWLSDFDLKRVPIRELRKSSYVTATNNVPIAKRYKEKLDELQSLLRGAVEK